MTFNQNPLTCININTLAVVHLNYFECAKPFHLYDLVFVKTFLYDVEYCLYKATRLFVPKSVLGHKDTTKIENIQLTHLLPLPS